MPPIAPNERRKGHGRLFLDTRLVSLDQYGLNPDEQASGP
jgi:hypothetical protein